MNSKPKPNLIEDLLLEDALDPASPTDKIRGELRAAGVDIDAIVIGAVAIVGPVVRTHLRERSTPANNVRADSLAAALVELATWPIDRVQAWLRDVAEGRHGEEYQPLAQPCFRNRSADKMTEEELRNLAAEIKATMGCGDGR
jgi:hypothetical protein